jgi:hypothetical protein
MLQSNLPLTTQRKKHFLAKCFRYFRGFRTKDLWEFYRIWNHRLVFLLIGPTKPITGGKGVELGYMCDGSEGGVGGK